MNRLFGACLPDESSPFFSQIFIRCLIYFKLAAAILYFAEVDDVVTAVDYQVDFCSKTVFAASP